MVTGGDFNVDFIAFDVQRAFDVYGPLVEHVKGKATRRAKSLIPIDPTLKEQITKLRMTADVIHVCGQKFMISISSPLELLLVVPLNSLSEPSLGQALEQHLITLRSRGFDAGLVYVDPQRGQHTLAGYFPGLEIDVGGAGDHLAKLDIRVRRVKELIRGAIATLPYKLPKSLLKDLVTYSVTRLNTRRTSSSLIDSSSPRVRFTGRKIPNSEFELKFGDYCEVKVGKTSNVVLLARSNTCIALYPVANAAGSWCFHDIQSKTRVRRSLFSKLIVNDLVVAAMSTASAGSHVNAEDIEDHPTLDADRDRHHVQTHLPLGIGDVGYGDAEDDATVRISNSGSEIKTVDNTGVEQHPSDEDRNNLTDITGVELEHSTPGMESPTDGMELDPMVDATEIPSGLRRSTKTISRPDRYSDGYSFMNMSPGVAIKRYGKTALRACYKELHQWLFEKNCMLPMHLRDLNRSQRRKIVRSFMFCKSKYDAHAGSHDLPSLRSIEVS